MSWGTRIKDYRIQKKLSQKIFSEKIGITQSALSSYELEVSKPSLDILIKMAETNDDLDLNWILIGENRGTTDSNIIQLRAEEYKKTIAVLQKAIEMLYDKYQEDKK